MSWRLNYLNRGATKLVQFIKDETTMGAVVASDDDVELFEQIEHLMFEEAKKEADAKVIPRIN